MPTNVSKNRHPSMAFSELVELIASSMKFAAARARKMSSKAENTFSQEAGKLG
jgi:hypothetical protein